MKKRRAFDKNKLFLTKTYNCNITTNNIKKSSKNVVQCKKSKTYYKNKFVKNEIYSQNFWVVNINIVWWINLIPIWYPEVIVSWRDAWNKGNSKCTHWISRSFKINETPDKNFAMSLNLWSSCGEILKWDSSDLGY